MPARLQTLGQLRLLDEGGLDIVYPEKALLILCFLRARRQEQATRSDIALLLWDDAHPAAAFTNLRQTLRRVAKRQRALGRTYLAFDDTTVMLGPDPVECDIDAMGEETDPVLLARLLTDDFLRSVRPGSQALASWIATQREGHRGLLRRAALRLAERDDPGDRTALSSATLRLLENDPADEEIRTLLTGYAAPRGPVAALPQTRPVIVPAGEAELAAARSRQPRIVLLPPVTSHATRGIGRFAEALIEDVTIGLCSMRSISLIAPHTATQISRQVDKAATYSRHRISYILETRLHDEGDGYTLFAQLIFFGDDEIIWADRFPLRSDTLLHAREAIARRIAAAIADGIERNETARGDYERDCEAYRAFLSGQSLLGNLDLRHVRRARKSFREALVTSSDYAPALGGLARSYFLEWLVTARGDGELLRQAEDYAEAAVKADETLPSAYRELGVVKLYARQFDESEAYLNHAEQLSPHYANVIASHADTLVQASRPEAGLLKIERAIDLNPMPPDEYFWTAAGACYSLGDYQGALAFIARMKDKTPADRISAAALAMLGETRKARLFIRRIYEVHPDFDLDSWMAIVPIKEEWQRQHYYAGLRKAGL